MSKTLMCFKKDVAIYSLSDTPMTILYTSAEISYLLKRISTYACGIQEQLSTSQRLNVNLITDKIKQDLFHATTEQKCYELFLTSSGSST